MNPAAVLVLVLWTSGTFLTVMGTRNVSAWYGDTIVVPCQGGNPPPVDMMFVKWKTKRSDGPDDDLLVKQPGSIQATIQATGSYAQRISIDENYSLHITQASLRDQQTFTCMVASETNLKEYSVQVFVNKKPSSVEIMGEAKALIKDNLTPVGTCVVSDANPAATITWKKGEKQLEADGKGVVITSSLKLDPATGLSTTSSTLQYSATKKDKDSVFTCVSTYEGSNQETPLGPFPIYYPSEKASLEILSKQPIVEGDNLTLKCSADGNPPPNSFFFIFQTKKIEVKNSDTYTFPSISRDASGEYKCSLHDNEEIQASQHVLVNYLDLTLSPSGKIVKMVGDSLSVKVEKNATGDASVSWTKDGKMVKEPEFTRLTYRDAGVYMCKASMGHLTRNQNFELVVEGSPVITSLTKHKANDSKHQVLVCEAEGFPEPKFKWSVNYTSEKSSYINGKAVHNITVILQKNLTIVCNVSNKLGEDVKIINIHPDIQMRSNEKDDQVFSVLVAVGVILLLALVIGISIWLYRRNSRRGSFKTETTNPVKLEETMKLAENNEKP
ncbi:CD166 antigen homolog [Melanotaenia boesemani]|uniref:CD166 antigen homolog n=1 Tax=Melanotaenia boesemani TaxID=1250792 RepID=UPI001C03DA50|nr:CD166 antigen homolog [Melanotaenia boesemani]